MHITIKIKFFGLSRSTFITNKHKFSRNNTMQNKYGDALPIGYLCQSMPVSRPLDISYTGLEAEKWRSYRM